ncbi:MAG: ATP-binding protein [Anaerolineae bacterium]
MVELGQTTSSSADGSPPRRQAMPSPGALIDALVEGIVGLDAERRIIYLNAGAERIIGCSRADLLGRSCDEVFRALSAEESFSALVPSPGGRCKVPVALPGGRRVVLSVTRAHPVSPEPQSGPQTVLVLRDVSEEEAFRRLLSSFLANVAHELRTPLSALAASVQLLLDQLPDLSAAELEELLGSLHLGVWRLQSLVDNLLEAASLEAGHFRVFAHPCNVREIVAEAVFTIQPLVEQHRQRLVLEVPEVLPPARADFRRTVQVLINLLSNASKYGPERGVITVTVTVVPAGETSPHASACDFIRIAVADQGPGLPERARTHLVSTSPDPSALQMGTAGLGLSVVKAIVRAQQGEVGVETRPEGGAVVWFTIPVAVLPSSEGSEVV